ncbi:hypothetical protein QCA50_008247 [Cerrena zonata]|uniref:Uncharacterized protein n=1 Tax=Cerrena zonata TaxID=2478898 RepID=A0AAW0GAQ1_9APHY
MSRYLGDRAPRSSPSNTNTTWQYLLTSPHSDIPFGAVPSIFLYDKTSDHSNLSALATLQHPPRRTAITLETRCPRRPTDIPAIATKCVHVGWFLFMTFLDVFPGVPNDTCRPYAFAFMD